MADDFNLFDPEQFTPASIPEQDVPDVPTQAVTPEQRPVRRRRRRRRPTWQIMLMKYWPPVRLGLMVIAGILVLCLLVNIWGAVFPGEASLPTGPSETPTDAPTDPTNAPTDPTPPPTEPPTEPPTDPPPTDPFAGGVADAWFDNTLFLGDFTFGGLRDSAKSGNADYFAASGMGVFNYDDQKVNAGGFKNTDLESLLAGKTYDKIIVSLGINDCGYSKSSLLNAYGELINFLLEAQPDAKIIIHGMVPVSRNYAGNREYFSGAYVDSLNQQIANFADGEQIFYIFAADRFLDSSGFLDPDWSINGAHLTSAACKDWEKLIRVAIANLAID